MKSYIMVSSDVLSNNNQDTVLLSTHANRINRNFPNNSTVSPCWGPESTHRLSSLVWPQHPTYSLIQEAYLHSGLGLPALRHRCDWFQSCYLLIPDFHLAFLNWSWNFLWGYLAFFWWHWPVNGTCCLHWLALLPCTLVRGITAKLCWGHPWLPAHLPCGIASLLQLLSVPHINVFLSWWYLPLYVHNNRSNLEMYRKIYLFYAQK